MAAGERAFRFWLAAGRPRWPGTMEDQSRYAHDEPTTDGRASDGRTTASLAESPSESECRRDVAAGETEDLERPLRQLDAPIVMAACPVVKRLVQRGRFVERGKRAERTERRERRAEGRWGGPHDPRSRSSRHLHTRAELHDACYCPS